MSEHESLIFDFINGDLPDDKLLKVEQKMRDDPDFANEVIEALNIKRGLDILRIRGKVRQAGKKVGVQKSERVIDLGSSIAATVIFFIATTFIYRMYVSGEIRKDDTLIVSEKGESADSAEAEAMTKIPLHDSTKSTKSITQVNNSNVTAEQLKWIQSNLILIDLNVFREGSQNESQEERQLQAAWQYIDKGQFRLALKILNEITQTSNHETIRFLNAYCHFNLREYKEAKTLFLPMVKGIQYPFESEWNYLLCCYLLNEWKIADDLMEKILADPEHPYFDKAQIMNKLLQ